MNKKTIMEEVQEKVGFKLPNRKVTVKPIRGRGWLPDNHEASFLFKDSYYEFVTAEDKRGGLNDPLTSEEREFFEDKKRSGMTFETGDLSIYKKEDNFWHTFKLQLMNGVKELDLSKPMDYLYYKMLLTNKSLVCPTADPEAISRKYSYKYYIAEEGEEIKTKALSISDTQKAYKAFGRMEGSIEDMKDFLKQYKLRKPSFKKFIPEDAKPEFLTVEIDKILKDDIRIFLDIIEDPLYEDKKLVVSALETGAIEIVGRSYQTPEGVHLGDNADSVVKFLNSKVNNEIKLQIIGRIENAK